MFFICDNCKKKSPTESEIVYFWTCPHCSSKYDYRESISEESPDGEELKQLLMR